MFILKNCFLIDGVSDIPLENAMIVVDNGKICYVGEYSSDVSNTFSHLKEIDINGQAVMPGMIDAHVHLCMDGSPDNFWQMIMNTAGYAAILGLKRAVKNLEAGFTTIRCCGEKGEIDIDIRQAINDGYVTGPRILASGKAITISGGHGDMFPGGMKIDGIAEIADGVEEVRRVARLRIKKRVDNIKLMATGGGMSPGPATVSQLNEEEMHTAVIEANKNNICTAAHCIGEDGCYNAVLAGVRTIEHGTFLNSKTIDEMVKRGTYLISTLSAFKTIMYGKDSGVPQEHLKKVESFAVSHYKNLKEAI